MQSGFIQKNADLLKGLLQVFDWVLVFAAGLISHIYLFGWTTLPSEYWDALIAAVLCAALVFPRMSVYVYWRGERLVPEMRHTATAWFVCFAVLCVLAQLTQRSHLYQPRWSVVWFLAALSLLLGYRIILRLTLRHLRTRGYNSRKVVILGAGEKGRRIVQQIRQTSWAGFSIMGFFDDNAELKDRRVEGCPVLGKLDDLPRFMEERGPDQVWIALPFSAEHKIEDVLKELVGYHVEIHLVFDHFSFDLLSHSAITHISGVPGIVYNSSPMVGISRVLKAAEDRVLALCILALASLPMLAIAGIIRLTSRGPVLYKQRRLGWNGREIEVWKFRTMVASEEANEVRQATRVDQRVTPFGRWLRRTSLDEMPQFFNVLQGHMSIVGPRPHAVQHNEYFRDKIDKYMHRHKMKPGITGWAQINGWRGETDTLEKMENRIKHDLYYIQNWSLFFDIKIIFITLFKGFYHRNAY